MGVYEKIKSRRYATDIAIIVVVCLVFAIGIFIDSRRSGGIVDRIAPSANALPEQSASSETDADTESESENVAEAVPTATQLPATPEPTPVPAGVPNPEQVGQQVFLDLAGIENESVVDASEVTIVGSTTPDALVSINGQAVEVELDGTFSVDLALDPGPNFVEIASSNLRGQETSRVISVVSIQ